MGLKATDTQTRYPSGSQREKKMSPHFLKQDKFAATQGISALIINIEYFQYEVALSWESHLADLTQVEVVFVSTTPFR